MAEGPLDQTRAQHQPVQRSAENQGEVFSLARFLFLGRVLSQ
jgi:hypothetical protein